MSAAAVPRHARGGGVKFAKAVEQRLQQRAPRAPSAPAKRAPRGAMIPAPMISRSMERSVRVSTLAEPSFADVNFRSNFSRLPHGLREVGKGRRDHHDAGPSGRPAFPRRPKRSHSSARRPRAPVQARARAPFGAAGRLRSQIRGGMRRKSSRDHADFFDRAIERKQRAIFRRLHEALAHVFAERPHGFQDFVRHRIRLLEQWLIVPGRSCREAGRETASLAKGQRASMGQSQSVPQPAAFVESAFLHALAFVHPSRILSRSRHRQPGHSPAALLEAKIAARSSDGREAAPRAAALIDVLAARDRRTAVPVLRRCRRQTENMRRTRRRPGGRDHQGIAKGSAQRRARRSAAYRAATLNARAQ